MLNEYNTAIRMREVIEKITSRVINRERPLDKVGRVVDIDRGGGFAWVVYAGDENTSLKVRIYPSKQPRASDRVHGYGLGAIVRVSGPIGSRYVAEVLSDAGHFDEPRFYQPSIASAGTMESSLYSYYALRTSAVPPRDSLTQYYMGVLNFPTAAGMLDIYTEMILEDGKAYQQYDTFKFDDTTSKNVNLSATVSSTTSSGMALTSNLFLYAGDADGEPVGTVSVTLSQILGAAGTKNPVRSNILLKVFGTDPKLLRIIDGTSLE